MRAKNSHVKTADDESVARKNKQEYQNGFIICEQRLIVCLFDLLEHMPTVCNCSKQITLISFCSNYDALLSARSLKTAYYCMVKNQLYLATQNTSLRTLREHVKCPS